MKKILSLAFASFLLFGCSSIRSTYSSVTSVFSDGSTVDMTYDCNPAGATIVEQGGNKLGTCPVTVQYHPNEDQIRQGKFYTKKIAAVWADGSATSIPSLTVDIPADHHAHYTFMHSDETPPMASSGSSDNGWTSTPPGDSAAGAPMPSSGQVVSGDGGSMSAPPQAGAPPVMQDTTQLSVVHQDQDFFDNFNRKANCEINNALDSKVSGCTPDQGF